MVKVLQVIFLLGVIIFLSFSASAQSHASEAADISVSIVTELSLSKTIDLKLEDLNSDSIPGIQTKKLFQTGRMLKKIQKHLPPKSEIIPASFALTGSGKYIYAVTIPPVATALNKNGEPIKVETYLSTKSKNTNSLGRDSTFTMSGKIRYASNQRKGSYVLVGGIDLAVNYN